MALSNCFEIIAFYASYTSRLNLSLEDLSANLNVSIRYGFTSNPKSLKNAIKMYQHYHDSNRAKYGISIVINYRDVSQYRYYHSALMIVLNGRD